jgi:hypothetical protein
VGGILPARELRQLALLLPDAAQLVGDVVHAGIAHVALQLSEALRRLVLQRERVRVELLQVAGK